MKKLLAVLSAGLVLSGAACDRGASVATDSATKAGSPIQGVWRVAEYTTTGGANPSTVANPASLYIFTATHYSMMRAVTPEGAERTQFKAVDPVNEEKIGAYDSFMGNSGTYELIGTTMTIRPVISKHPNYMGGGYDSYEIRSEGDTLWMANKSTSIRLRMGSGLVGSTGAASDNTIKLVRVE